MARRPLAGGSVLPESAEIFLLEADRVAGSLAEGLVHDWAGGAIVETGTPQPPGTPEGDRWSETIEAELGPEDSIVDEVHESTDPVRNDLAWRTLNTTCVPEPMVAHLSSCALLVLAALRRRRRRGGSA